MTNISGWSTTAASNNSASPNGFPENMPPSGVNDSAREVMAAVRAWYEAAEWINLGHIPTFVSTTSFTIPTDVTGTYHVGRRMRFTDATTLYGTIATSTYGAPNTTVTVAVDSGVLSSSLTAVAVSIISKVNSPLPTLFTMGVAAGNAVQVDQALTAWTRSATTTLGTTLNGTLSDTSTTVTAFNGVAGITYHVRCLGAGEITHHATNLIVTQGGASIQTVAGMTFDVEMITAATCRIKNIHTASIPTTIGVASGNVPLVNQSATATTREATTTLGTSLNHTLSDTSTTITAFSGVAGVTYHVRFLGVGAITHHATDLIVTQTGASITATEAGDTCDVEMITASTCRIKNYLRASGQSLVSLMTLGTPVASTSGTSIDYTGLPAGVKRITVMLAGVSVNADSAIMVQLGISSGVETSGYTGYSLQSFSATQALSAGFRMLSAANADTFSGKWVLDLESSASNTWVCTAQFSKDGAGVMDWISGKKALAGTLDRVRITTVSGTAVFDAGSVNISYEV
ncbi:MAG: hypothetical protein WC047_00500 [Kiritimatiellales bacterium]